MRILFIAITYLLCSTTSKADTYRYTAYGNITGVSATSSSEFIVNDPIEFSFEVDDTQTLYGNGGSNFIKVNNITLNLGETAQGIYSSPNGVVSEDEISFFGPYFDGEKDTYTPDFWKDNAIYSGFPSYNGSSFNGINLGFEPLNSEQINIANGMVLSDILIGSFSMTRLLVPRNFSVEWNGNYIYGDIDTTLQTVTNLSNPTDTSTPENPPVGTNTVILKTYKSNDMQNWELIESKEIQSEEVLFLKSEIITE